MSRVAYLVLVALPSAASVARAQLTEFPVPTANSRPYTIVPGADGALWFTESSGNKIARITTTGVITEYPVPTPASGPYGIAIGRDGMVWFTERFADQIGRFDPATLQFEEFALPTPFAQPWEIALAPDGKLWFTEEEVNQIGRITPQGRIREFVPPNCCFPTGIAAGADGNMWFTLEIGDHIGRVEPLGDMTIFTIPSVQVLPWDITAGLNGALWFTELSGRAVGRITTAGDILELPVPGPFSGITGVTPGPDGNLWFCENDTDRVGGMNAAGNVFESFDVGSRPFSITLGPDGNLWFTEGDANAIGRIELPASSRRAQILSLDAGFSPPLRRARLGGRVQWTFLGPNVRSVVDASGLGLFDSGPQPFVSYFGFVCRFASTFVYEDGSGIAPDAALTVPVVLPASASIGAPFPVTFGTEPPPSGLVFDVQVRPPGAALFENWTSGTAASASYTALVAGPHQFRARLRDTASGKSTLFSVPAAMVVN